MGLFTKLFKNKNIPDEPDNLKLLKLLDIYAKDKGQENYKNVYIEISSGNSYLLFPTQNDSQIKPDNWTTTKKKTTLSIASIIDLDGLKVLGAFTDEQAMLNWTKKPTEYTAMRCDAILKFCEDNGIDRVVINTDQSNMFVLERNRGNIREYEVKEDTTVQIGTPNNPLAGNIVIKLIDNFKKDSSILEVYQYGQMKEGQFSIVLGFKLMTNSDNAKKAATNAVQNALKNETLSQTLDLYFIETDDWYSAIKRIEKSLLYKR